jgi:L-fuconolactonase
VSPRRIDAHQHYWRPARGDYFWMPADGPLRRDYLPEDLAPANAAAAIDGTIVVQAAPTVAETDWLLQLAAAEPSILGVVGWAPLEDTTGQTLARLGADPRCLGIRPMLQDLPDEWIMRSVERETLESVARLGLVFDLLSYPRQLVHALRALEPVVDLVVVVDHLSKPAYLEEPGSWAAGMRAFAERPHTYCKLSGLITEVGSGWKRTDFRRHADVVLEAFGPERVLFGSDWPVCLTAGSHAGVVELAEWLIADLEDDQKAAVFGGNAERVYGLGDLSNIRDRDGRAFTSGPIHSAEGS